MKAERHDARAGRSRSRWWSTVLAGALASLGALAMVAASPSQAAAQDSAVVEVDSLAVSCPGLGRLDFTLLNLSGEDRLVAVSFGNVQREVDVPANGSVSQAITGRRDGTSVFRLDGAVIEEVQIRCGGGYARNDQFQNAARFEFANAAVTRTAELNTRGLRSSLEPGEGGSCLHPDATGSQWYSGLVPGSDLIFGGSGDVTVGVYRPALDTQPQSLGDLVLVECGLAADLATINVVPGSELWFQVSGLPSASVSIGTGDIPLLDVVNNVECLAAGGLVNVDVTNNSDVDVRVVVKMLSGINHTRVLTLAPGETGSARVGSRRDGRVWITVNDGPHGFAWVECEPNTAPNDTIATAHLIELAEGESVVAPSFAGSYGHTPAETDRNVCVSVLSGSSWYRVVAPTERLVVNGSDDQLVAVFTSAVAEPSTLSDLSEIVCAEPEDLLGFATEVGATYWLAVSEDTQQAWSLQAVAAPINDTLASARDLADFDLVPDAAAVYEAGESTDCVDEFGFRSRAGTLWWKWVADRPVLDLNALSFDPASPHGSHLRQVGVWSATVDEPGFDDLIPVGCSSHSFDGGIDVNVGETYWLQVRPKGAGMSQIGLDPTDADISVAASCLAGRGRIDVTLSHGLAAELQAAIDIVGQRSALSRTVSVAEGTAATRSVTGRPDGLYSIRARVGTETVGAQIIVRCQTADEPVVFEQSCLAGNGLLDVVIDSSGAGSVYTVTFDGPKSVIVRSAHVSLFGRFTVTGRPDGEYNVSVFRERDGVEVLTAEADVSC